MQNGKADIQIHTELQEALNNKTALKKIEDSNFTTSKLTQKLFLPFFFFSRTHKDKSQHTISNRVWPLGDHMAPRLESPAAYQGQARLT